MVTNERMTRTIASVASKVAMASIAIVILAAWFTHIVYCIQTAKYLLLIAGAILVPVGIIHGLGLWIGVF